MISSSAIVTQGHIPDFDPQGALHSQDKLSAFELSLWHLRLNNPHAYIILTGHGTRPENSKLCDWVYWEDRCRPLDGGGLVIGMPAQYEFVDIGIRHAISKGFKYCLKLRTDSLWGIPYFEDYCAEILRKEKRQILLSQQTCHGSMRIGDCIMYGESQLLHKIWNKDNPVIVHEGLQNTAHHFAKALSWDRQESWESFLRKHIAFRDTISLEWADLRWMWHQLMREIGLEQLTAQINDNSFDFHKYQWGLQWHKIEENGVMSHRYLHDLISEKEWYGH